MACKANVLRENDENMKELKAAPYGKLERQAIVKRTIKTWNEEQQAMMAEGGEGAKGLSACEKLVQKRKDCQVKKNNRKLNRALLLMLTEHISPSTFKCGRMVLDFLIDQVLNLTGGCAICRIGVRNTCKS